MSNFLNKIPVSPITSFGNPSVPNGSTIGTNFSILQTGGFMEVYTLSGLTHTIPPATTGIIEFSGNSIPIQFTKGSGSVFSPDVLTLNSDNISSGRRKLGMLVYVYETNKIYQFRIDNYDTLWNNATGATGPGGPTVVISNFGTTVKNNSAAGIALINAWTASTISGIGGYDDTTASWRVLSTGGGTSVTGGTFNNNTDTLTLNNSTGGTVTITGFTDYYTTGFTFNPASYDLTIKRNDGLPDLSVNLSILSSDVTITGGTYNSSTGTATFTNNTGGTFNVTGFLTGFTDIYVTGGTFNNNNQTLTLTRNDNANVNVSGFTDVFVTGGTYSGSTIIFRNNTGGTFNVTGITSSGGGTFTGGTVTGPTTFTNGLTANTISATTYQNLPATPFLPLSGGTVTGDTIFTAGLTGSSIVSLNSLSYCWTGPIVGSIFSYFNNTIYSNETGKTHYFGGGPLNVQNNLSVPNGSLQVGGNVLISSGLTANTISATTYQNLPTDIRVTGGTYTGSTIIFTNNTGGTFSVTGLYTGGTDVFVTGATKSGNVATFTNNTGGTFTLTGLTDTFVTGGTYSGSTIVFTNNSGGTFNVTGITSSGGGTFTGGTVTGATNFTGGLTANTISATTYFNLPTDIRVTGGTYSNGTATFTNNTGGTFSVTGITTSSAFTGGTVTGATEFTGGLTANTISATTYFNLPTDIRVTGATKSGDVATFTNNTGGTFTLTGLTDTFVIGGTYSGSTIVFTNNSGGTFDVTGITTSSAFTGGTVTGATSFTGGLTANTISATTYQNLPATPFLPLSGGTVTGATSFTNGLTADTISATTYNGYTPANDSNVVHILSAETITGVKTFSPSVTAATAIAKGTILTPTLIASANSDVLVGLDIAPTFTTGAFTGLGNYAIRHTGDIVPSITNSYNLGGQSLPYATIYTRIIRDLTQISYRSDNQGWFNNANTQTAKLFSTGNLILQNGGTFTDNGARLQVYGNTFISSGLTANTISATTYFNLPTDIRVTGGTYDTGSSSITFTNNSGGTFSVTGITSSGGGSFTGGTVSGATEFTGGLTANTISATTITSPSISPYGLIVATSIGYQNIF